MGGIKVNKEVIRILSEFTEVTIDKIDYNSYLAADLGLSSLDLLNILARFEDEFQIEVDDRSLPDYQTVGDIVEMLNKERDSK